MIENREQLFLSQRQLKKLRSMEERTANDLKEDFRLRESKLAGICSMIAQLEKEIRMYHLTRFQESLKELQVRSKKTSPEELPELFAQMIGAMEEFTTAIQPII